MDKKPITAYILSLISFALLITGFVTSWMNSKYSISEELLYTELALFFVVPLFFVTLPFAIRGSLKARLIWLGLLSYPIFKVFEKTHYFEGFNSLFFVASLSFALFAIILGIYNLDLKEVKLSFPTKASRINITVLLVFGVVLIIGTHFSITYYDQAFSKMALEHFRGFVTIPAPSWSIHFFTFRRIIILGVLLPLFLLNTITILRGKMIGVILTPIVLTSGIVCFTSIISLNSILSYCSSFTEEIVFIFEYYYYPLYLLNIIMLTVFLLYVFFLSLFLVYYMIKIKELNS